MNLPEVIEDIQYKVTKNIKDINRGGCIHFAYYLSETLKKYGFAHKIIAINEIYYPDFEKMFNYNDSCRHIMVYIKGIGYIDGQATYSTIKEHSKAHRLEIISQQFPKNFDLNKLREMSDMWNPLYDIRFNSKLEYYIKTSFKKIEYVKF